VQNYFEEWPLGRMKVGRILPWNILTFCHGGKKKTDIDLAEECV